MTDARTLTKEQLLHLVDRARRGSILPPELDDLHGGITAMGDRLDRANKAIRFMLQQDADAADTAVRAIQLMNEAGTQRDQAEAAIERVRAVATELSARGNRITGNERDIGRRILAALDQAQQPTTTETSSPGDASMHWTCAHCAEPITSTDWTWEAGQDPAVSVWDKPRFHVDRAECQAAAGYPGQPTTEVSK